MEYDLNVCIARNIIQIDSSISFIRSEARLTNHFRVKQ